MFSTANIRGGAHIGIFLPNKVIYYNFLRGLVLADGDNDNAISLFLLARFILLPFTHYT